MSVAIILALSLFGLAVAFYYSRSVSRVAVDMGVDDEATRGKLRKIHAAIAEGAMGVPQAGIQVHGHLHDPVRPRYRAPDR